MALRIGLNGFGRIGRYLTRLLADSKDIELAVVNARADNKQLAHLLKYDSVHRTFTGSIEPNEEGFLLNGRQVLVTRCGAGEWKWGELGCDVVVESTGKFTDRDSCAKHLACGAKKVVISAPGKNADVTIVMGVNEADYDGSKHNIVSAASCTTNCLAPVVKALHEAFTIKHAIMTTIHSYTMSQRILDGSQKDLRRARAAAMSMIPTTTGAAKAVTMVIPSLKGKIDGMSIRVPTPNVSLVDLTSEITKPSKVADINAALSAAANDSMGYSDEPLVSVDYLGSTFGGIVDGLSTAVIDDTLVKVLVWYDNESGFTNQLVRLIKLVSKDF